MTESPEQIAARYGAVVAPGVVVQVIPRGVSGVALPVLVNGRWEYADGLTQLERNKRHIWRTTKPARTRAATTDPQIAVRREAVRVAHAAGKTVPEMVQALRLDGVEASDNMVRRDLIQLGLAPHRATPAAQISRADSAARRVLITELAAQGLCSKDIAAALTAHFGTEISPRRVLNLVAELGIKLTPAKRKNNADATRDRLRLRLAEGANIAVIAREMGVTRQYLHKVARVGGIAIPAHLHGPNGPVLAPPSPETLRRHALIADLLGLGLGLDVRGIWKHLQAAGVCVHIKTVRRDLALLQDQAHAADTRAQVAA